MKRKIFPLIFLALLTFPVLSSAQSDAGPDQTICSNSTYLDAVGEQGDGTWSVVSGIGTFADNTDPHTLVTGIGQGTNVYRWTVVITSGIPPMPTYYTDDVTIINNEPSDADAGADQTLCANHTTLSATSPTIGSGEWSVVSGVNIVFDDNTSATATVSN